MRLILQIEKLIAQLNQIRALSNKRKDGFYELIATKFDEAYSVMILNVLIEDQLDLMSHLIFRNWVKIAELVN